MKLNKIICTLSIAASIFTGCQKEISPNGSSDNNNNNNSDTLAFDPNGNIVVGNDADRARYSIISRVYNDNSSTVYDDVNFAFAWFGSAAALKDAGDVTVNEFALTNFGGFNYYNCIGFDSLFYGNEARWQVAGNSANAIAGFSHTDNIPFPTGGDFTLPERINITQNFTIHYTPINNVYGIVYSVRGNKGEKNKAVLGGGSLVTFSAAELSAAAFANDAIAFSLCHWHLRLPLTMAKNIIL